METWQALTPHNDYGNNINLFKKFARLILKKCLKKIRKIPKKDYFC